MLLAVTALPNRAVQASSSPHKYTLPIIGPLSNPDEYTKHIQILENASLGDEIVIQINSPGGRVDILMSLVHAISVSKATIKMQVLSSSYSAAAILACYGDQIQIAPHSILMFHGPSYGGFLPSQKVSELIAGFQAILFTTRQLGMECVRKGILTQDELDSTLRGSDVYKYYNFEEKKWKAVQFLLFTY